MDNTFVSAWNSPLIREMRHALMVNKGMFRDCMPLIDLMERTGVMNDETLCAAMIYMQIGGDYEFADEIKQYMPDHAVEIIEVYKDYFMMTDTAPLYTAATTAPLQYVLAMTIRDTHELLEEIRDQEEFLRIKAEERRKEKPQRTRHKSKAAKGQLSEEFNEEVDLPKPLTDEQKVEDARAMNYIALECMGQALIEMLRRVHLRECRDILPPELMKEHCKTIRTAARKMRKYNEDDNDLFLYEARIALTEFAMEKPFNQVSGLQFGMAYPLPETDKKNQPRHAVMKFHVN